MDAPDFTATSVDGKTHRLSELKGNYIYLNFGNSFIDQTQKDLNVLMRFHSEYGRDLAIVNVFLYDQMDQVMRLSLRFGGKMNFWVVKDSDAVKKLFGIKTFKLFWL